MFEKLTQKTFDFSEAEVVAPKMMTPAVIRNNGECEVLPMRFGLVPPGSSIDKEKKARNNARFENLDIWPWKMAVKRYRCIVPMSSFYEFSYWGEKPGYELEFSCEARPILFVAGIYCKYADDAYSMTLITRPASDQMMNQGHHRMPAFVDSMRSNDWLTGECKSICECQQRLMSIAIEPEFTVTESRAMKDGWQKRVDGNLKKRDDQIAEIEKHGPFGKLLINK